MCPRSMLLGQGRFRDIRGLSPGSRDASSEPKGPDMSPNGGWLRPANVDSSQLRQSTCLLGTSRRGENLSRSHPLCIDGKWRQGRNLAAPCGGEHGSR